MRESQPNLGVLRSREAPVSVTVCFDLTATVISAFESLWPEISCEVGFAVDVGHALGCDYTVFPDNGSPPQACIDPTLPLGEVAEVLAHEPAHVTVGLKAEHGPEWAAAFAANEAEYCCRAEHAGVSIERDAENGGSPKEPAAAKEASGMAARSPRRPMYSP